MSKPSNVTPADMRTTRQEGAMPEHLKAWGETEETWDRCDAMWTLDFDRAHPIKGCPLGRGTTIEAAMRDLVRRTNAESGTAFVLVL